jgi:hypothetical protein
MTMPMAKAMSKKRSTVQTPLAVSPANLDASALMLMKV